MEKINVGIIGGAGYTGGELIRILLRHPRVNISFAQSHSHKNQPYYTVHHDLFGETNALFTETPTDFSNLDALFFCMGHGKSKEFMENHQLPDHVNVIDLSQDFRIKNHHHQFVYGLPELSREEIRQANYLANPGCFATAIQLTFLPLLEAQKLSSNLQITATTGSTGAGQSLSATSHFSWRNSNLSVYKSFTHQHLLEINQTVSSKMPDFAGKLNFVPCRGDFTRGIFCVMHTPFEGSLEEANDLYRKYYSPHPFTHVTPFNPSLKMAVNTNKGYIYLEKHGETLMVVSMIDNLLKGASGQAVQNMNLMFGFLETEGLLLKGTGF